MDSEIKAAAAAAVPYSSVTPCVEKIRVSEAEGAEPLKKGLRGDLGPETPVPERGSGEAFVGSDTPLTCVSSSVVEVSDGSEVMGLSCDIQTPKSHVFNPFAPGPEELAFAPRKKGLEEFRYRPVVRQLNFDSDFDSNVMDGDSDFDSNVMDGDSEDFSREKYFLESIYESLLDAIITKQAEGILTEDQPFGLEVSEGFKTPTKLPLLTGIADTCPGAPMKPAERARNFNLGICRKLEF
ncbi:uncharacterized protein LOC143849959 [Tasmannia lanceolata]|uniref:uncharacterized protein LOC143849959 n=1 Tax=Tasmannia lanceolata TaxID=3420 RepID=UPI0040648352